MKRHDGAHLLMGTFDAADETATSRRGDIALLRRVARMRCRRGRYAVTILSGADGGDLAMLAVEHRDDALQVSRALRGRTAVPFGPWLTHRCFRIDATSRRAMTVATMSRVGPDRRPPQPAAR